MLAINIACNIPSLSFSILYAYAIASTTISDDESQYLVNLSLKMYTYIRIISGGFNLAAYIAMAIAIRRYTSSMVTVSHQMKAIQVLVDRLKYYPIVQIISRIGPSWYEIEYGYNFTATDISLTRCISDISVSILAPVAAIGYFAIFLLMQPKAYQFLMHRCWKCKRYEPPLVTYHTDITETVGNVIHGDKPSSYHERSSRSDPSKVDHDSKFRVLEDDELGAIIDGVDQNAMDNSIELNPSKIMRDFRRFKSSAQSEDNRSPRHDDRFDSSFSRGSF
jgi:hypothetical protein